MSVVLDYNVRGGLHTTVSAKYEAVQDWKHRIRAAADHVVDGDSILLVKEKSNHPNDELYLWIPPGGGDRG